MRLLSQIEYSPTIYRCVLTYTPPHRGESDAVADLNSEQFSSVHF